MSNFPTDSTEYKVQESINKLIDECGKDIWSKEFQNNPEFNTTANRLDTLGIILSKFCEWEGEKIKDVAMSAFEDSNYHDAEINLG